MLRPELFCEVIIIPKFLGNLIKIHVIIMEAVCINPRVVTLLNNVFETNHINKCISSLSDREFAMP